MGWGTLLYGNSFLYFHWDLAKFNHILIETNKFEQIFTGFYVPVTTRGSRQNSLPLLTLYTTGGERQEIKDIVYQTMDMF